MEGLDEAQQGYPEEAPPGTDPGGEPPSEETPQRKGGKVPRKHPDAATESGDGKATGNPRSAG